MLRFIIITVLVLTFFVFVRLVLLRLRRMDQPPTKPAPPIIDAEPQFASPMEIKNYRFANFDHRVGPSNPENFHELLYVDVGPEGSTADVRRYALHVTTPKGLSARIENNSSGYRFGSNLLVVERFDLEMILRALRDRINELPELGSEIN
jgi:hypothetical protein